jgi:hypothetical protein
VADVTENWWSDDDTMLATVREALEPVPESFLVAARAAFAWHNIDAELAALTYDSAQDALAGAGTRAEPASLRALTFDAENLTLELEIIDDVLHGQLVPARAGTVELRHIDGTATNIPVNDVGYFTVSPLPSGRFRLYCVPTDGEPVLTDWITL